MTRPWSCPDCGGRLLWLRQVIRCSACRYFTGNPAPGRVGDHPEDEERPPAPRSLTI